MIVSFKNVNVSEPKVFDNFIVSDKNKQTPYIKMPVSNIPSAQDNISLNKTQQMPALNQSSVDKTPNKDTFISFPKVEKKDHKKLLLAGASLLTIASFIAYKLIKKTPEQIEVKKLLKLYKEQMAEFPEDIVYRKKLLEHIDIPGIKVEHLRPILGPQEYKKMLTEFNDSEIYYSPGKTLITAARDGYDLSNYDKGLYRANLHLHSNNSDGEMPIDQILAAGAAVGRQAAKLMEKGAKMPQNPFTIAITDHDTLEGCKKAVKQIVQDPLRYKSLRVVLGCELSVENKTVSQALERPITHHLLAHVINPFDKKLNEFLDLKKNERVKFTKAFISRAQKIKEGFGLSPQHKLSYEDAKELYPALNHGIVHTYLSSKDYCQFRTIYSECFENNPEIQRLIAAKKIKPESLDYKIPKNIYLNNIKEPYKNYWEKYQAALSLYTSELLKIPQEQAKKLIVITPKMREYFTKIDGMVGDFIPKMDLQPAYVNIEDVAKLIKAQEYGFVGIAHPAIIDMKSFLKNPADSYPAIKEIITNLKKIAGERAAFIEGHYHYFGKNIQEPDGQKWLKTILDTAKSQGMLYSGGVDTHGSRVMYSL